MGMPPTEVRKLSVFQYMAAMEGFIAANDPDGDRSLSAREVDELWDWLKQD